MYEPNRENGFLDRTNQLPIQREACWPKNTREIYQKMMNKVFMEERNETLDVYIGNMISKSGEEELHDEHVSRVFQFVFLVKVLKLFIIQFLDSFL